jgi:hypothetical protein
MWNDAQIKALNSPTVAAALPERPIFVITVTIGNAMNELTTTALNASVPRFATQVRYVRLLFHMRLLILALWHSNPIPRSDALQVGAGPLVTYPVEATNRSVQTNSLTAFAAVMAANADTFGFWQAYEVFSVRTEASFYSSSYGWAPALTHTPGRIVCATQDSGHSCGFAHQPGRQSCPSLRDIAAKRCERLYELRGQSHVHLAVAEYVFPPSSTCWSISPPRVGLTPG